MLSLLAKSSNVKLFSSLYQPELLRLEELLEEVGLESEKLGRGVEEPEAGDLGVVAPERMGEEGAEPKKIVVLDISDHRRLRPRDLRVGKVGEEGVLEGSREMSAAVLPLRTREIVFMVLQ